MSSPPSLPPSLPPPLSVDLLLVLVLVLLVLVVLGGGVALFRRRRRDSLKEEEEEGREEGKEESEGGSCTDGAIVRLVTFTARLAQSTVVRVTAAWKKWTTTACGWGHVSPSVTTEPSSSSSLSPPLSPYSFLPLA